MDQSKNICEIDTKTLRKIADILNTAEPRSRFYWRSLIAAAEDDVKYSDIDIEKFANEMYSGKNPAFVLLYDLGNRGFCVKDLIKWLEKNRHERALELIKEPEPLKLLVDAVSEITVGVGQTLELSCEATGFPYPHYQWFFEQIKLTGQNKSTLKIENMSTDGEGDYICSITNSKELQGIFTQWVQVTVNPTIYNRSTADGGFNQINPMSSYHSIEDNRKVPQRPLADQFQECLIVSPAQSCDQRLGQRGPPVIVDQPCVAVSGVSLEEPVHLTCTALGSGLSYQWLKDDTLLPGQVLSALVISSARLENAGKYQCIISNKHGEVRTKPVQLTIRVPITNNSVPAIPKIILHPFSLTVAGPGIITFRCRAHGKGALRYQWFRDGNLMQGECKTDLTVAVRSMEDEAKFQCEVFNENGKVLSNTAKLNVNFRSDISYTAQDKVALLIANKDYTSESPLLAAPRDILTLSSILTQMNFKVVSLLDLNLEETNNAVETFCELLGEGVYGLFYFCGHGFEHNGQCFLAPVDVKSGFSTHGCIAAEKILMMMQNRNPALSVLLLDICRERNERAKFENPKIYVPNLTGNTVYGYAASFSSRAFETEEGFFMRNLKNVLNRKKPIDIVLHDMLREFDRDRIPEGYKQFPEVRSNLRKPLSLMDEIYNEGYTQEFNVLQEKWHLLVGDLLKEPAPMKIKIQELGIVIELKCSLKIANMIVIWLNVLESGKTEFCKAFITNIPNEITIGEAPLMLNPSFCKDKTITELHNLQRLQGPLMVDILIRYQEANDSIIKEIQHPLKEIKIPIFYHNFCRSQVKSKKDQERPSQREPSEQDEKIC